MTDPASTFERVFEASFDTSRRYDNPFLDVDVDVVFTRGDDTWRVPAFWHGGGTWTVRFAPDEPGDYAYHLESSPDDPELNGHAGTATITAYAGENELLRRGPVRVSSNGRYFEHRDGTPFYWLGDTWYTGFSDRIPWEGFQRLVADRVAKGFSVAQMALMTVTNEERAPIEPGFINEGGAVWDPEYRSINPAYFDAADRRAQFVVDSGIVPVLFGAWRSLLDQVGIEKVKKYWRYLVARYAALPVIWIAGGEIHDHVQEHDLGYSTRSVLGWTDVVRYIREIDAHGRPLSVHEGPPALDTALQDETITDFDFFQPSHFGWDTIPGMIAQLNMHYARTTLTRPLVVAEIGWETLGGEHHQDFQRAAFWLAMLNGAAGFSYGNAITGESYDTAKPLHRTRYSLLTWEEAMDFPSTRQLGYGANLLRTLPWQDFSPHPEWVTPRGTTILEPQTELGGFDVDFMRTLFLPNDDYPEGKVIPAGEWQRRQGDYRLPYAAGVDGGSRVIFIPALGFAEIIFQKRLTVHALEDGVRYRAFYLEPTLGVKFDLGDVELPDPGAVLHSGGPRDAWTDETGVGALLHDIDEADVVVIADLATTTEDAGLLLRYRDPDSYLVAMYSAQDETIYLADRVDGVFGLSLGLTLVPSLGPTARLRAEVRDCVAIVSISDGATTITSPIVDILTAGGGPVGILNPAGGGAVTRIEVRASPLIPGTTDLERTLTDAEGRYRGELADAWQDYGRSTQILLDAYRPERLPFPQDWVLVLDAGSGQ